MKFSRNEDRIDKFKKCFFEGISRIVILASFEPKYWKIDGFKNSRRTEIHISNEEKQRKKLTVEKSIKKKDLYIINCFIKISLG